MRSTIVVIFFFAGLWLFGNTVFAGPIYYTTDLEGDLQKWREFVELSGAFERDAKGALSVVPGRHFVFGGDSIDRRPGHVEILRELVALAERSSETTLIMGNRDLNKIPFAGLAQARDPLVEDLQNFLEGMNARHLFENHRQQMRALNLPAEEDLQVYFSLTGLMGQEGWLRRYIRSAKIGQVIGNTLFVHGSWRFPQDKLSVQDNVDRLNEWKNKSFANWENGRDDARALFSYQADPSGVIYSDYSDSDWNPRLPDERTRALLMASGIHRIVVGHRPYGQTPAILRSGNFELILADNSLCDGCGVNIVEIQGDRTRIRSRLTTGEAVDFSWTLGDENEWIGHYTDEGALIVGRTADGDWILFKNPGAHTFTAGKDLLVKIDGHFHLRRHEHPVSDEQLTAALQIEDPRKRVETLTTFHGEDFSFDQIQSLMDHAPSLSNSFEIAQYIRFASESRNIGWASVLQNWIQQWTPPQFRWQGYMVQSAREALNRLDCEAVFITKRR